jgi:hypothetical protein
MQADKFVKKYNGTSWTDYICTYKFVFDSDIPVYCVIVVQDSLIGYTPVSILGSNHIQWIMDYVNERKLVKLC